MSFIRGTATGYQDLSDIIHASATGSSLVTVDSVSAGGTGYVVGEIITFTTGTFTVATQLEVLTLSGSAVATVRVYNAGAYSVAPSDSNATTASASGTGATFTHTYAANGWTSRRNQMTAISVAVVSAGGTDYTVGDVLTIVGGTKKTTATLTVSTISGGGGTGPVTAVTITEEGVYSLFPTNPAAVTGGTGNDDATFTLTWGTGEKDVILEGNGDGTDEIFVGWRTLSGAGYYNFELHGFTGFDSAVPHTEQIGMSPGEWDHVTTTLQQGAFMLCNNSGLSYWLNINSYRIIIQLKVGTAGYFNAYLGFGNRYGTETEYAYPMVIAGHTSYAFSLSNQSKITSGLVDPWTASESGSSSTAAGPMFVMMIDNTWKSVSNGLMGTSLGAGITNAVRVTPTYEPQGTTLSTPTEDHFLDQGLEWNDIILNEATGTPEFNVLQIPGTVAKHLMIPCTLVSTSPSTNVLVELDDVYWMSSFTASGVLSPEDRIIDGTDVYRVFQNCNRSNSYGFLAIKEA